MKQILVSQLEVGDIFAKEVKLHDREALRLIEISEYKTGKKKYIVKSGTTGDEHVMDLTGHVVLLRKTK